MKVAGLNTTAAKSGETSPASYGKKIGVLGGTFDPVHFGHLAVAEKVFHDLDLDTLLFVPAKLPPHKINHDLASFDHRLTMLELAIAGREHFYISALEGQRQGPSYTVDTLAALHELLGEEVNLYFIIGFDAFAEVASWKKFRLLPGLTDFVVIDRQNSAEADFAQILRLLGDFSWSNQDNCWMSEAGAKVMALTMQPVDISSTMVRQRIGAGEDISQLVPVAVEEYLRRKGLYGS